MHMYVPYSSVRASFGRCLAPGHGQIIARMDNGRSDAPSMQRSILLVTKICCSLFLI